MGANGAVADEVAELLALDLLSLLSFFCKRRSMVRF